MPDFSPDLAKNVVQAFLTSQFDKKTEKEQRQLAKAIEDNDLDKISELKEKLSKFEDRYSLEVWMDNAANRMTKQIGFGTHISKGIHSSSKGDNINFDPNTALPKAVVGHQSIKNHQLDASGNAAALPLYSFFEFEVQDGKKVKDYIIENDNSFELSLSSDPDLSKQYFKAFRQALVGKNKQPITSEYNKQTLWPHANKQYTCIIPLYPSSLTNIVFQKIQHIKYSDETSSKRKNRFSNKEDVIQAAYPTISDIAVVKLGGSNPQGVSRHMSTQGGINYLLPSLPPTLTRYNTHFKPSRFATSIFSNALEKRISPTLLKIFSAIKTKPNNVKVRDLRKQAMDEVLTQIFDYAHYMQNELPAGWSKDQVNLNDSEKFWLDPRRAELEGEESWKEKREAEDWHKDIIHSYARWINSLLKKKFKDIKDGFSDTEHTQWERDMQAMIDLYERAGKGVFL